MAVLLSAWRLCSLSVFMLVCGRKTVCLVFPVAKFNLGLSRQLEYFAIGILSGTGTFSYWQHSWLQSVFKADRFLHCCCCMNNNLKTTLIQYIYHATWRRNLRTIGWKANISILTWGEIKATNCFVFSLLKKYIGADLLQA